MIVGLGPADVLLLAEQRGHRSASPGCGQPPLTLPLDVDGRPDELPMVASRPLYSNEPEMPYVPAAVASHGSL